MSGGEQQRVTQQRVASLGRLLRKEPRTTRWLLRRCGSDYQRFLRRIPGLQFGQGWDPHTQRFQGFYWIVPARRTARWRRAMGLRQLPLD